MADKFHRAARDGYLISLKEATKKDCNQPDEDGLTPTATAAHEGRLDALRILVGRGGDPDKCDLYGNTSLHCAAMKGHMHCVSFLVNFGVNIWALDNDFHSALDLAAINNKEEIVRYLDIQASKQELEDTKKVKKVQEKAKKEAEKRQKEFDKIQKKADKKRQEEELKIKKETETLMTKESEGLDKAPKKKSVFDTLSKNSFSIISGSKSNESKSIHSTYTNSPRFSELTQNSSNANKKATSGIQRKILKKKELDETKVTNDFKVRETEQDGKKSMKNLSGLQRDSEILFVPNKCLVDNGKRGKITDVFHETDENYSGTMNIPSFQKGSIFDRPGFGSVAFRSSMTSALSNIPSNASETSESSKYSGDDAKEISLDSQGSSSLSNGLTPWDEDDLLSEEEDDDSPLFTFLAAYGLQDYMAQFVREHIDLEALMLLNDQDLESIKMPLGPRRKLLKILNQRRLSFENPGEVMDVKL